MASRVAVLGGGLQGACVALELASSGTRVDLFERDAACLRGASARNEGKIHLGYVYAADRSLRTARTMVAGAIAFAPLLRRWIGEAIDTIPVSQPFLYAVHARSLLRVPDVDAHFRAANEIACEASRGAHVDYFGANYRTPPRRLSAAECGGLYDPRRISAAYATQEIGIDSEALCDAVRARLACEPRIRCFTGTRVLAVDASGARPVVRFELGGVVAAERYDHVVNALGDDRLAVDATAGLEPQRAWMYRVKHFLRVRAPDLALTIPSTTIVLGPFGDVAAYDNGAMYLSWYPAGLAGASSALRPPAWRLTLGEPAAVAMRAAILAGLAGVIPAVAALTPDAIESCEVKAGVIFAWGQTDIDDPASGLHERHAVGPRTQGRYHSVDPGKLTMAPFFAVAVADRIRQIG